MSIGPHLRYTGAGETNINQRLASLTNSRATLVIPREARELTPRSPPKKTYIYTQTKIITRKLRYKFSRYLQQVTFWTVRYIPFPVCVICYGFFRDWWWLISDVLWSDWSDVRPWIIAVCGAFLSGTGRKVLDWSCRCSCSWYNSGEYSSIICRL